MSDLRVLTTGDQDRWLEILSQSRAIRLLPPSAVPRARRANRRRTGSTACLRARRAAPLPSPCCSDSCGSIEGLEGETSKDVGSVYGYAGPLVGEPPPAGGRHRGLPVASCGRYFDGLGVVAAYSRLHPLIPQAELIAGSRRDQVERDHGVDRSDALA